MRLIDADRFKDCFNTDTAIGKTMCLMIDEQPTAYDVDKSVKSINEIGQKYCNSVKCDKNCDDCEHGCLMMAITNAVKSGGVADE